MGRRRAGLLLHPTSLPGPFGVGDFGREAEKFLDWAACAGQTLWQVLPLHPTGAGDSPYSAVSAFAGNPLLISPERLREEGFLPDSALAEVPRFSETRLDSALARRWKNGILRASWEHSRATGRAREDLESFRASPERAGWLSDWALFAAHRERYPGQWPRDSSMLVRARREMADEIEYQEYLQFLFFRQWARVRDGARRRGIAIIGDLPIFVTLDSADVWAHPELFLLDASGRPELVAGVPPDAYSADGQLWGYPLYRWEEMEKDGFSWWIARIRAALAQVDVLRVDHFRGFAAAWAVDARATSAVSGRWQPGPGKKLFEAVREALGEVPLIAEDLGTITEDVRELLAALNIPGMKVLQFAFSEPDSEHLPHHHVTNCVVYTGTHDNDTARGWFAALPEQEKNRVRDYVGGDGSEIEWALIRAAFTSVADRAIVPVQDVFGLGSEARFNTPGRAENNWTWRAAAGDFTAERAFRLRRLAELTGRAETGRKSS